ncbi:hypothetical protein T439DRAFT_362932 [Meredithblackwellia eburnea MCA 4105]
MSNATFIFDSILDAIPPGSNIDPFLAISSVISGVFYPSIPNNFNIQLYVLAGLYFLFSLVITASLVLRARAQGFWIFRLTRTSVGSFITPHYAVSWQLPTLCFTIYCLVTISHTRAHLDVAPKLDGWLVCGANRCSRYFGDNIVSNLLQGMQVWALCVANALPSASMSAGRRKFFQLPIFLNTYFVAGAVFCTAIMVALSVLPSINYDHSVVLLHQVQSELSTLSEFYAGTTRSQLNAALEGPKNVTQRILDTTELFIFHFRMAWGGWVVFTAVLYLVFLVVAVMHFRRLHRELSMLRQAGEHSGASLEKRRLLGSWRDMAITAGFITAVGVGNTADCVWLAVGTHEAVRSLCLLVRNVRSPQPTEWGFAALGFPAVILIFKSSLAAGRAPGAIFSNDYAPDSVPQHRTALAAGTTGANRVVHPLAINVDVTVDAERETGGTFELTLKSQRRRGVEKADSDEGSRYSVPA